MRVNPQDSAENETPLQRLIRERLAEKDWKVPHIVREGGLSRSTVYSIVNGRNKTPDVRTLRGLALGLGLPFSMVAHAAEGHEPVELDGTLDHADGVDLLIAVWSMLDADGRRRVLILAREHLPRELWRRVRLPNDPAGMTAPPTAGEAVRGDVRGTAPRE